MFRRRLRKQDKSKGSSKSVLKDNSQRKNQDDAAVTVQNKGGQSPTIKKVTVEEEKQKQSSEQKSAVEQTLADGEAVENGSANSEDSDPNAALKSINNLKRGSNGFDPSQLRGSMNRYDEFASYANRSERSHAHPDPSPTAGDLANRKVKVDDDLTIHKDEGDAFTEAELKAYFMQDEDFRRCDADVELTTFRWEKHKKSRMPFDEKENTLRGLEEVIVYDQKRESARIKHVQDIVTETRKQRIKGKIDLDWEKIRSIGLKTSVDAAKRAREIGAQDEKDAKVGLNSSKRFTNFKNTSKDGNDRVARKSVNKVRMMMSFRGGKK